ncbi:MAG: hypothetical protein DRO13_05580 [Thermoprotei archaeon]|nr:MAG: hypothetical protein DRO13_05580 [Thermoprotei archaeon]
MGLEVFYEIGQALSETFSAVKGVGAALVIAGVAILLIIGVSIGLYALIRLIKRIPYMTVWEFIKFTVVFALALIVVGIVLP